jgi:hypothetical protein
MCICVCVIGEFTIGAVTKKKKKILLWQTLKWIKNFVSLKEKSDIWYGKVFAN